MIVKVCKFAYKSAFVMQTLFLAGKVDGISLSSVLNFVTGAYRVPPLGFRHGQEPSLYFIHNEHAVLATASTCDMSLGLPTVHKEYSDFYEKMVLSILGHSGFGQL